MKSEMKTSTLFGLAIVLAIIAGLLLSLSNIAKQQRIASIDSYEKCAAAGYPIMESYPTRCSTPDGKTFTNPDQSVGNPDEVSGGEATFNGCAVAGCSQTLCVSADEASDVVTTCEYRAEYACYREASCEPQSDGTCGWTQTNELKQCLANPPALDGGAEVVY